MFPSDHRGMFLDVDIVEILDAREIDVQLPAYRRLKCTIPKRVKSYCAEVISKWQLHKIHEKVAKLEDMSTVIQGDQQLYVSFENFLNQYDDEISGILSSSERNCCEVSRHCTMLFSPTLQKLLREKRQLQQQISKMKKIDLVSSPPSLMQDLKSQRKQLHSVNIKLREYSKTQREKRTEFLEERAKDLSEQRGLPKSKISSVVKNLKHIEKQIFDA